MIFSSPPQFKQCCLSISNTRWNSLAQAKRAVVDRQDIAPFQGYGRHDEEGLAVQSSMPSTAPTRSTLDETGFHEADYRHRRLMAN
jgi:hypothetical protein